MLTKSAYMEFLRCPREFWLAQNSPARTDDDRSLHEKHLREQGYDIQRIAQKMAMFQTGIVSFQMKFQTEMLWTSADIVVTDLETTEISIYEVKSGSKVKPEYIEDIAFQKMVAEGCGHRVAKTFVITVDTTYTRNGEIDPEKILVVHEVTADVIALQAVTEEQTRAAIKYLETEPQPNIAEYCDKKFDCAFIQKHFTDIPEYNVMNISRLDKKKCADLLSKGILDIRHVPADFKLSDKQRRQVDLACSGETWIEIDAIRERLDALKYPLSFLDYETFSYAVPHFEGLRPYQQMLFQYSLHTFTEPGAEPVHTFHVSRADGAHPAREMIARLRDDLDGQSGSVVVWYDNFEKRRNLEGALMFPEFAGFLEDLNSLIFDLRTIFSDGLYIHPGFRGKTSIKRVLPVLCSEHSYDALEIGDGITASIKWYHMATRRGDEAEQQKIYDDLCAYCHLDTLAMVKIFEVLKGVTSNE